MTRIVAGDYKGRRLRVPPRGTRPTSERVREALFSALESEGAIAGARVLDLYAGSGALGLEALSRGAESAVFVEADAKAAGILRGNIDVVGVTGARVVRGKAATVLGNPDQLGEQTLFDLVLIDPPYAVGGAELGVLLDVLARDWLAEQADVVLERAARDGAPPWPDGLELVRERKYGDSVLFQARLR